MGRASVGQGWPARFSASTLGKIELTRGSIRVLIGRIGNIDRLLQSEIQFRFRRNPYLCIACSRCAGRTRAAAGSRADSSPLSAAKNSTECGAYGSAHSCANRRTFTAGLPSLLVIITRKRVRLALEVEPRELQCQLAAAGEAAGGTGIRKLHVDIRSSWNDRFAIDHNWKCERCAK